MSRDFLAARARSLESIFFMKEDAVLLQKHKELQKMEENRKVLSDVSGITSKAVLDKLIKLNVTPDLLASISVVPLVEVAWADGAVDAKERQAILAGARKAGVAQDSIDYTLLNQWLQHRPPRKLMDAWHHYIEGLCDALTEEEKTAIKKDILCRAETVARASGSFLGLTSGISDLEKKKLAKLEEAFAG